MSIVVNPIEAPQAWDHITIGQTDSPGLCWLKGFKRSYGWDIKKGKGALGATLTFTQRPPAKGTVEFHLWLRAHFDAWDQFLPLLKYDPTKKTTQAIDIYHPALADIFITSVVTEDIGQFEHSGEGLYTRTVSFIEFFPPPPASAVSTPSSSKNSNGVVTGGIAGGLGTGNPLQSEIDKENALMAKLLKQAQEP
jgi:hypothetical protein